MRSYIHIYIKYLLFSPFFAQTVAHYMYSFILCFFTKKYIPQSLMPVLKELPHSFCGCTVLNCMEVLY